MPKNTFQFACPCCDQWIEVDVRSGKARAVDPKERKGKNLDALIDEQAHASEQFGSMFDAARRDQKQHAERLEDLLSDAAKRAKKDKDKRPHNPFDLE